MSQQQQQQPIINIIQQQQQQQQSGGCGTIAMWTIFGVFFVLPIVCITGCFVVVGGCTCIASHLDREQEAGSDYYYQPAEPVEPALLTDEQEIDLWIENEIVRRLQVGRKLRFECIADLCKEEFVIDLDALKNKLLGEIYDGTFNERENGKSDAIEGNEK